MSADEFLSFRFIRVYPRDPHDPRLKVFQVSGRD